MKNKQLFLFIFSFFLCLAINTTKAGKTQNTPAILQQGIEHLRQDQFDQARKCFNHLVQDSSYTIPALIFLGISYQNQYYKYSHDISYVLTAYKYYSDALNAISQTNQHTEMLSTICLNKAYILLDMVEQGQLELFGLTKEEALAYAHQCLNVCLNQPDIYKARALFLHGCSYLAQHKEDQARLYFEQAANLNYHPALHNLACIQLLQTQRTQAEDRFSLLAQDNFEPSKRALKLLSQKSSHGGILADGRLALTTEEIARVSALPASRME